MHLLVSTDDGEVFQIEVSSEMTLENFFVLCRHESQYIRNIAQKNSAAVLSIFHEGRTFTDLQLTLQQAGVKTGDLVMVRAEASPAATGPGNSNVIDPIASFDFSTINVINRPSSQQTAASSSVLPSVVPNEQFIKQQFNSLSSDPHTLNLLELHNPEMADAVRKNNYDKFAQLLKDGYEKRCQEMNERRRIMTNPLSAEAQKFIMKQLQQSQVDEQMQIALEHTPESFGSVPMLYINCRINDKPLKAFVDSGAQSTIMSERCAEMCNLTRLIDTRFAGEARGVGKARIIGRVHLAQLQIESAFLPVSLVILEDQMCDMLLGLDMLRRHQCSIDLKNNLLHVGHNDVTTPFLPESEHPDSFHHPKDTTATSQAASTSKANSTPVASSVDKNTVAKLVQMGFSEQEATEALKSTKGDVNEAAALLIASGFAAN